MQNITNFSEFNVSDNIKKAIEDMGFEIPTPIQSEVIPHILEGKDVIAQAPTGTGKTCAFAIPIIQNIDLNSKDVQALVLCPTRELVIQMNEEFKELLKYTESVRVTPVYGGQNIERQLANLRKKPQIVLGTPGRLMDHINRRTIKLHNLSIIVLDEADEMLDMGFRQDIDTILKTCPQVTRQTVLFSATMPKPIIEISANYQTDPVSIVTKVAELPSIEQIGICCEESQKVPLMTDILDEKGYQLCIAFCNTKKRVDELAKILTGLGYNAEALHGDLRQSQRDKIMKKYRGGQTRILVATDVAARGIDVDNVEAIFNFDTPNDEEYYVHRIGRTARANKSGVAYTFYTKSQSDLINKYERYTKTTMSKYNETQNKSNSTDFESKKLKNIFNGLSGDLRKSKDFISNALREYNATNDTDWTALDLLAVAINGDNNIVMTENNSRKRVSAKKEKINIPSTRYFLTIGNMDRANESQVIKFITSTTGIDKEAIVDVHLLEKFGFVEIAEGFEDFMDRVNGAIFNGRKVTCEVAGERSSGADRRVSAKNSDRPSRPSRNSDGFSRDRKGGRGNGNSGSSRGTGDRDNRSKRSGETASDDKKPRSNGDNYSDRNKSDRPNRDRKSSVKSDKPRSSGGSTGGKRAYNGKKSR